MTTDSPQAMTAEEQEAFEARVRQVRLTPEDRRAISQSVEKIVGPPAPPDAECRAAMRACLDRWYEQRGLERWDWDDLAKASDDLRASWVAFLRAAASATTAAEAALR